MSCMKSFLIYVYHVKAYKGDLWLYSRNYCGPGSKLKHEILGDIFDVKQFLDAQPKILSELTKRNDPDLEFFY